LIVLAFFATVYRSPLIINSTLYPTLYKTLKYSVRWWYQKIFGDLIKNDSGESLRS